MQTHYKVQPVALEGTLLPPLARLVRYVQLQERQALCFEQIEVACRTIHLQRLRDLSCAAELPDTASLDAYASLGALREQARDIKAELVTLGKVSILDEVIKLDRVVKIAQGLESTFGAYIDADTEIPGCDTVDYLVNTIAGDVRPVLESLGLRQPSQEGQSLVCSGTTEAGTALKGRFWWSYP